MATLPPNIHPPLKIFSFTINFLKCPTLSSTVLARLQTTDVYISLFFFFLTSSGRTLMRKTKQLYHTRKQKHNAFWPPTLRYTFKYLFKKIRSKHLKAIVCNYLKLNIYNLDVLIIKHPHVYTSDTNRNTTFVDRHQLAQS